MALLVPVPERQEPYRQSAETLEQYAQDRGSPCSQEREVLGRLEELVGGEEPPLGLDVRRRFERIGLGKDRPRREGSEKDEQREKDH